MLEQKLSRLINETTTGGDIAYLPSGVTSIQNMIKMLLSKKKNWAIDVYEDKSKDEYKFSFEGHNVLIPKTLFKQFESDMKKFGKVKRTIDGHQFQFFSNLIKEAQDPEVDSLRAKVESGLNELLGVTPCKEATSALNFWSTLFQGAPDPRPLDVIVSYFSKDRDVKKFMVDLEYEYGEARGLWEMALSAIEQKRPLRLLNGFSDYSYLYGQSIVSSYKKSKIVLVSLVDTNMLPYEKIQFIGNDKVLEEIEGYQGVKVYKNEIFPASKHFPFAVFSRLKKEIDLSI